ncbi:LacI family DNA-binding transcriptional regulator [Agrilactobacillus fermenti]|uniref:LacI family DNA-binding transcriptional regulator n=1 Tax=Agrilactobacillus fermenti TaxID=2586909 RepID=UPI001E407990|nr:LacI family DNA-binding transcriptional regulator [Agrilactobacillus fermenti]MCD2255366.1 LacI family DNA-binding transcriptional regulator [Agrilactobacillus fermenti]
MTTLKDVARLANVSASTVSRVLNHNPAISTATQKKVLRAMQKLRYVPNSNARNLALQHTMTLGVILPATQAMVFSNPFFVALIQGINHICSQNNYLTAVATGDDIQELQQTITMMAQQNKIRQFILLYSQKNDPILQILQQLGLRYVILGKPFENSQAMPYVDNDNILAGTDVTTYLLKQGHRAIGFLYSDLSQMVQADRLLGYQRAMQQSGLPQHAFQINDDYEQLQTQLRHIMALKPEITALITTDDMQALAVQQALVPLDLKRHISQISFNNSIFARVARPMLTSVEVFPVKLGEEVARLAIQDHAETFVSNLIIPHRIIERSSVWTQ